MGFIANLAVNAIAKKVSKAKLAKRYENDPSRGFHELAPSFADSFVFNACYLQSRIRKLPSESKLRIALPEEAVLPRGWSEIWDDYVLIDEDNVLYGTTHLDNLRRLGLELGDVVTVQKGRDEEGLRLWMLAREV